MPIGNLGIWSLEAETEGEHDIYKDEPAMIYLVVALHTSDHCTLFPRILIATFPCTSLETHRRAYIHSHRNTQSTATLIGHVWQASGYSSPRGFFSGNYSSVCCAEIQFELCLVPMEKCSKHLGLDQLIVVYGMC